VAADETKIPVEGQALQYYTAPCITSYEVTKLLVLVIINIIIIIIIIIRAPDFPASQPQPSESTRSYLIRSPLSPTSSRSIARCFSPPFSQMLEKLHLHLHLHHHPSCLAPPPLIHAGRCSSVAPQRSIYTPLTGQQWRKRRIISSMHRPVSQMSPVRATRTRYAPPAILTETRAKTLSWRGCAVTIAALRPTGLRVPALRPRGQPLLWDVSPIPSPSSGVIRSASRWNTARAAII